jgi:hypothetical protein
MKETADPGGKSIYSKDMSKHSVCLEGQERQDNARAS